jgi:hypothetical protein
VPSPAGCTPGISCTAFTTLAPQQRWNPYQAGHLHFEGAHLHAAHMLVRPAGPDRCFLQGRSIAGERHLQLSVILQLQLFGPGQIANVTIEQGIVSLVRVRRETGFIGAHAYAGSSYTLTGAPIRPSPER